MDSCPGPTPVRLVDVHQLASVVKNRIENVLIIDSRSFIEHNACHVATAVNVCCSKIVKRRLQQDKLSVKELIVHTCHCDVDDSYDVVVYDQQSKDTDSLPIDSFITILLKKLQLSFRSVNLLSGGFNEFQTCYPELCEDKTRKCPPLTSLSQPCLPISNQGPTRILPFLYLGSQFDALNKEMLKDHNITYELNVSTTCPMPDFVPEGHFMRIPVNDNYSEKLLPYFPEAFNFLDKVREGSGCVLVHCLAGISRSPTVAIAYVMRYLRLTSDDGYRYVKSKRPTISPNFNFLGQLLEYEKQLRREQILDAKPESSSAPPICGKKRLCRTDMRTAKLSLDINTQVDTSTNIFLQSRGGDQSPTTALAKLSFGGPPTPEAIQPEGHFAQFRSKSCYGDFLRDRDDSMIEHRAIKESHVIAAAGLKPLSPVKEIKCESLISEISAGHGEVNLRTRSGIHQRETPIHCRRSEKQSIDSSHTLREYVADTVWSSAKFSVHTLSHISCASDTKNKSSSNIIKKETESTIRDSSCLNDAPWPSREYLRSEKLSSRIRTFRKDASEFAKFSSSTCPEAFRDVGFKKPFASISPTPDNKSTSSLNPFSFATDLYKRSDSAATSGFGSESSDCADMYGDDGQFVKQQDRAKIELDIEELEDDVILRGGSLRSETKRPDRGNDSAYFSLTLPEVAVTEWPRSLESPLSPSETHLLEDLVEDRDISQKTGTTSPSGSDHHSADTDSIHDSGVLPSPPWPWTRKRVAAFDDTSPLERRDRADSFCKDKRKCEPIKEPPLLCQNTSHHKWYPSSTTKTDLSELLSIPGVWSSTKVGLYRVQSCPGIVSQLTGACCSRLDDESQITQHRFRRKTSFKEVDSKDRSHRHSFGGADMIGLQQKDAVCHESCPDALHLGGRTDSSSSTPSSPHHRDFRRNVRMIQVS